MNGTTDLRDVPPLECISVNEMLELNTIMLRHQVSPLSRYVEDGKPSLPQQLEPGGRAGNR